jgi:hypothetical protein
MRRSSSDGAGKIINLATESFLDDVLKTEVSILVDVGRIVEGVNLRLGLSVARGGNVDAILSEFSNPILKANRNGNI